jgi:molybdopterin-binding protein
MRHGEKLTRGEAAAALGLDKRTLAEWERIGRIPAPERDHRGWRYYEAETIAKIRTDLLGGDELRQPPLSLGALEISAENRLEGIVRKMTRSGSQWEVSISLASGEEITAHASAAAISRLGLRVGDRAVAVFRAADVMLAR